MPPPEDVFSLEGTILDGKYRIDRVVAEGGFGFVYAAHHLTLDVPLALKVLKPNRSQSDELRADVVAGFIAEARTTARLSHPNIARAFDTGVMPSAKYPEGLPWIALEWLDGRTLENELAERRGQGGRSPKEALTLLGPVMDAMDHAHRLGVAHRDLKPSNVMLIEERGRLLPKVLDFGIAKLTEAPMTPSSGQTATKSALITFSPGYAAPEQVSMTRTGPWTDVHALALLVVELLSDQQVYGWSDTKPILAEILASERPSPARRGLDVGPWEGILQRALSLSPAERQPRAGALLEELSATVDAAEQHWRFKALSERPNVTAPLPRSQPPVSSEPVAATTDPSASGTTTAASVGARSVGPAVSGQRRLQLLLFAGVALVALLALVLGRSRDEQPGVREPLGSVRLPAESVPPSAPAVTGAPLATSASASPPSALPVPSLSVIKPSAAAPLSASPSAVRPHATASASAAARPKPTRLLPTDKFE